MNKISRPSSDGKLDQIISRLSAQQPTLPCADELTDRIMQSLPEQLEAELPAKPKPMLRRWAVAASIAALFCLSVAAATITYHVVNKRQTATEPAKEDLTATQQPTAVMEKTEEGCQEEILLPEDITFKNQTLAEIARQITAIYGCKVEIADQETAALRLYFNFPKGSTAKDFVKIIDDYETLAATIDGDTITIKRQEAEQ